jgi:Transcriptional regulator, AbiEi antitoxin
LAETAADRFGLVTIDDAREDGYEPKTLVKLAGRGQLERVSRGVYRVPFMPGGAMQGCAGEHLGRDLLEQAARHGRARGLLSAQEHEALVRELGLEGVSGRA